MEKMSLIFLEKEARKNVLSRWDLSIFFRLMIPFPVCHDDKGKERNEMNMKSTRLMTMNTRGDEGRNGKCVILSAYSQILPNTFISGTSDKPPSQVGIFFFT
jgi:hypothetical protein